METRSYQNPWNGSDIDNETHVLCTCIKEMSRKLKLIAEFGKEILDEVKYIQLSKTRDEFDEINTMFYVKWLSLGSEKIDSFIDYYHEQWVNSGESNWFAGAGPIDINNGLEAINKDIKVLRFSVINRKLGHPL